MELDLPDWDEDMVDDLTDRYRQDIARIRTLPGVSFIEA
jgi:hypothetical protein